MRTIVGTVSNLLPHLREKVEIFNEAHRKSDSDLKNFFTSGDLVIASAKEQLGRFVEKAGVFPQDCVTAWLTSHSSLEQCIEQHEALKSVSATKAILRANQVRKYEDSLTTSIECLEEAARLSVDYAPRDSVESLSKALLGK